MQRDIFITLTPVSELCQLSLSAVIWSFVVSVLIMNGNMFLCDALIIACVSCISFLIVDYRVSYYFNSVVNQLLEPYLVTIPGDS